MAEPKPREKFVNQVDAARLLGIDVATLRDWKNKGVIMGRKAGPYRLYAVKELLHLRHRVRRKRPPAPRASEEQFAAARQPLRGTMRRRARRPRCPSRVLKHCCR